MRYGDIGKMDLNTKSTSILLLYAFVVFNAIRYWRRIPYGSEVGSFTWITHRGTLLVYVLGFMALTAQPSCKITTEGSPPLRHALCHLPYIPGELIFALHAVVTVKMWASAISEVVLHWRRRSHTEPPTGGKMKKDSNLGGRDIPVDV